MMRFFVRLLRFFLWTMALLAALFTLGASTLYLVFYPSVPDVERLRDIQLQIPLRIYTQEGQLVAEFGEQRRTPVGIQQVPQDLINAFLAAEDARFHEHPGVDITGLTRAAFELVSTGSIQSGGSTITMQVAKNYFLSQERTFTRKFTEILLAFKIEQELTKNEILELYFNKIYLGNRAYGIEAAANVYYGKSLAELDLAQMAMIAGLPKAPSRYNPLAAPVRAMIRRNWILDRMLELKMIDPARHAAAVAAPVTARYFTTQPEVDAPYVAEMARLEALALLGPEAYTGGYQAYLTISGPLQQAADRALRKGLLDYTKRHGYRGPAGRLETSPPPSDDMLREALGRLPANPLLKPVWIKAVDDGAGVARAIDAEGQALEIPLASMLWANRYQGPNNQGPRPRKVSDVLTPGDLVHVEIREGEALLSQVPRVQGALVSLQPQDGRILALAGGFDFYLSKFNRATQAQRQPGSNFKPFVYLAALEQGLTAASVFNDAPVVFEDAYLESVWRPENSSGRFYGPTRLRQALYLSRNLVSIRLLQRLGVSNTVNFLEQVGFDRNRLPQNLSLALGTGAFTPLEVATGYALLANGGYRVTPHLITRITDHSGTIIHQHPVETVSADPCATCPPSPPERQTVADPRNLYILHDILKDVVRRGTATEALKLQRNDLAGKTGTTNDQFDAWFSGFNPLNATTVWVGFDQPETLGRNEYGSRAALPIWMDYMRTALQGIPETHLPRPDGIVSVRIDPETGERARPGQPDAIFELFTSESAPQDAAPEPSRPDLNLFGGDGAEIAPESLF